VIALHRKTAVYVPPRAEVTVRTDRNDWADIAGRFDGG
jgi:hypothetical protein